ncbi:MAG: hypothetical protein AAF656_03970 [Planctomycetota bacterium]
MQDVFALDRFVIRRKVFKLFGGAFHVYDEAENLVGYSKQKAFKLKEDIRLFRDESMSEPLLVIGARNVIDFSAAYDVIDPRTNEHAGTLRRKGLKSMLRDSWEILDANQTLIGKVEEDSTMKALVRRVGDVGWLFPQAFHGDVGGQTVFAAKQRFNPFVAKIDVDFSPDTGRLLDRRLGLGAAVLLAAIEGRQQ